MAFNAAADWQVFANRRQPQVISPIAHAAHSVAIAMPMPNRLSPMLHELYGIQYHLTANTCPLGRPHRTGR